MTLACALALAAPARAQRSPAEVVQLVKFEQRIGAQLPLDATFRDEAGETVRLGQYFGKKPVVLALVYYECPMLCTFVLNGVVKTLRALSFEPGREFEIVVVSFNPRETPELAAQKKQAYLEEYKKVHTWRGWHFLTGDEASIQAVTQAAGFQYVYDAKDNQFAHASGIVVAKPDGTLFRYFFGIEYAPRDLRLALIEASTEKIGTPVDQVLLYCFHYDPKTGKYGLLITRVIRLAGSATVLALGAFLLLAFRRERRGDVFTPGESATKA
jgi:protein SCO1/2